MPNKILQRVQRLLEKGQCQGFPIPIWIDWPLLTSLHPGGVRSSLASPHGNSRSSSGNCPGRRQRRQLLLQSCPGRRLYSASRRHLTDSAVKPKHSNLQVTALWEVGRQLRSVCALSRKPRLHLCCCCIPLPSLLYLTI